jgi:predicted metal-dependent phosphoesterase TrpH
MLEKGYVRSIAEAFDRWLAEGRPAFVPRERMPASQGIAALHRAGGIAVLAHPVTLPPATRWAALDALAAAGLDGVEADHSLQDAPLASELRRWAEGRGLLATGGSDFHGEAKPDVQMGAIGVGDAAAHAIRERISALRSR